MSSQTCSGFFAGKGQPGWVCVLQRFPWHLVFRMRRAPHFPSYPSSPVWPGVSKKSSRLCILTDNYHLPLNSGAESSLGVNYVTHCSRFGFVQLIAESNRRSGEPQERLGQPWIHTGLAFVCQEATVKRHWLIQVQGRVTPETINAAFLISAAVARYSSQATRTLAGGQLPGTAQPPRAVGTGQALMGATETRGFLPASPNPTSHIRP